MNDLRTLLGQDYFDGSSAHRAIPAPEPERFNEHFGGRSLGEESTAEQYCDAILRYLLPAWHPRSLRWEECLAIMGMRRVIR